MLICRVRKSIKGSGSAAVRHHKDVEMAITPLNSFADVQQFLTQGMEVIIATSPSVSA
jgi:hypothetical protein